MTSKWNLIASPSSRCPRARQGAPAAALLLAAAAAIAASALAGCKGFFVPETTTTTTTGTGTGDYVYVANGTTNTISGFSIAKASGALAATASSPYALNFSPTSLIVSRNNNFLYVGGFGVLYLYNIASNGSIAVANNGAAVASVEAQSMAISPDGQWLFILNSDAATLSEFQINATTGALTQAAGTTFSVGGSSQAVKVAPNGQFVFLAMGTAGDLVYPFDTTTGAIGAGTQLHASALTSDNALAIDSNSAYLYIARSGSIGGGIAAYSIGNGGALSEVSGSPTVSGNGPFSILLNSTGAYLYAANRTDGTVSEYSVGSSGVLTAITGSPVKSVGTLPIAMAEDNSHTYIAVASNGGSPDLNILGISASSPGTLSSVANTATGNDPANPIAIATTH